MITSYEAFAAAAQRSDINLVPVVKVVLADLHTPLGIYLRLARKPAGSFLLESIEGGESVARYSFIGAGPCLELADRGGVTEAISSGGEREQLAMNAVQALRTHLGERKLEPHGGLPPFPGGAVGYLAYEAAQWFEPALAGLHSSPAPRARFMVFDLLLAFDRLKQQISIVHCVPLGDDRCEPCLRRLYEAAVQRVDAVSSQLQSPLELPSPRPQNGAELRVSNTASRENFERGVSQIQELIHAGECYQAVLSQAFTADVTASPVEIYRALRIVNPSPYMFLLDFGDEQLIGSSPEMLVRCRDRKLEYRPIAGTRPRGASPEADAALAEELLNDEKEKAEHVMLVDLGRNDLGKVSRVGSVKVIRLMDVERYSHVLHMVSQLTGSLDGGCDAFDALGACFPAGTVTGAPKIRAMQIISELEPEPRGTYAGAVLYAGYGGDLDSCIAIRTIHLRAGVARVQAGAGIVADSQPAREFEETLSKSRALLEALAMAERGVQ